MQKNESVSIKTAHKLFGTIDINDSPEKHSMTNMDNNINSIETDFAPANTGSNAQNNRKMLSTLSGVFSPVALSMFSVLLFLRLGFVVGQAGIAHAIILYIITYFILLTTVLSVAAITTNGAVEGGGAYFMISRTLGPEFGGAIGVVFYFANVFSSALYCVGCAEALIESFGPGGTYAHFFYHVNNIPDSKWWALLYASIVCLVNLGVCLIGSSAFARASLTVLAAIVICALSIPLSLIVKTEPRCIEIPKNNLIVFPPPAALGPTPSSTVLPVVTIPSSGIVTVTNISPTMTTSVGPSNVTMFSSLLSNISNDNITTTISPVTTILPPTIPTPQPIHYPTCGNYTGVKVSTLFSNLKPQYGLDYTTGFMSSFMIVFAVVFSGATGIMAGANMSGDLKNPQTSIPRGTLLAVAFTFFTYISLTLLIGSSCTGYLLRNNNMVLAYINVWAPFITIGILLATITAGLSNLIGASRILEAVGRDKIFGHSLTFVTKTTGSGNPIVSVFVTWFLVQCAILGGGGSLNKIAGIVTVFFLLSYLAINVACFALELASAPNFRPSFTVFSWHTALLGALSCLIGMFAVTPTFSTLGLVICGALVSLLHWKTPAASWGSLSQALMFHQVRKYLLLLDPRKQHVKYWRPQILLLISDPRENCELIDFANDLKKSGLFVIGHIIKQGSRHLAVNDGKPVDKVNAMIPFWMNLIDAMRVKAFIEITESESLYAGAVQLIRLAGLGAMKPNTVVLGFWDGKNSAKHENIRGGSTMYTELARMYPLVKNTESLFLENEFSASEENTENPSDKHSFELANYVNIVRECLIMHKNVVITRNFHNALNKRKLFKRKFDSKYKFAVMGKEDDLDWQQPDVASNNDEGISNNNSFNDFNDSIDTTFHEYTKPPNALYRAFYPMVKQLSHVFNPVYPSSVANRRRATGVKCYIDVWPQNFFTPFAQPEVDTECTATLFMLQLACILNMKRGWRKRSLLRIMLCLEDEDLQPTSSLSGSETTSRTMLNTVDTNRSATTSPSIAFYGVKTSYNKHASYPHNHKIVQSLRNLLNQLRIPAKIHVINWSPSRLFSGMRINNQYGPGDLSVTKSKLNFESDFIHTNTFKSSQHQAQSTNVEPKMNTSYKSLPDNEYLIYVNRLILKHIVLPKPSIITSGNGNNFTLHSSTINDDNTLPTNYSLSKELPTAICFMLLPRPPILVSSQSQNITNAQLWHEKLELLTRGLPPLCLVHGVNKVTTTTL